MLRAIPRTVFQPVPNVDSVLVGMRQARGRGGKPTPPELRALVSGAFAHRRKTLSGSLGLSGGAARPLARSDQAGAAALGYPADVRAERLSPEDFRALARILEL